MNKKITQGAISELVEYDWPGNVRELSNIIERSTLNSYSDVISGMQVKHILAIETNGANSYVDEEGWNIGLRNLLDEYEKQILISVLEESRSATQAAKKLRIDKSTMLRKMKKYNILQTKEWEVKE